MEKINDRVLSAAADVALNGGHIGDMASDYINVPHGDVSVTSGGEIVSSGRWWADERTEKFLVWLAVR